MPPKPRHPTAKFPKTFFIHPKNASNKYRIPKPIAKFANETRLANAMNPNKLPSPTTNATKTAINALASNTTGFVNPTRISAKKTVGIDNKKLTRKASSGEKLCNSNALVVIPLRETPGKIESPWQSPKTNPLRGRISLHGLAGFESFCNTPEPIKNKPMTNVIQNTEKPAFRNAKYSGNPTIPVPINATT